MRERIVIEVLTKRGNVGVSVNENVDRLDDGSVIRQRLKASILQWIRDKTPEGRDYRRNEGRKYGLLSPREKCVPCPVTNCSKLFDRVKTKNRHVRTAHTAPTDQNRRGNECPRDQCFRRFVRTANLTKHILFDHI